MTVLLLCPTTASSCYHFVCWTCDR